MNRSDVEIIKALTNKKDYVSGEKLGRTLNVSRNTIWKHILKLKEDGYIIETSPKKGYRLISSPDIITSEAVAAALTTELIGNQIIVVDKINSTNELAKIQAKAGADAGLVVIANEQSQGRGRRGRIWHSQPGGLYFSILLRPQLPLNEATKITLLTGVTIVETLRKFYHLPAVLKWPNDILIENQKVCGILTELSANIETINYIVIGIGINCNQDPQSWPSDIRETATSLQAVTGTSINRKKLLEKTLTHFEYSYQKFIKGDMRELIDLANQYTPLLGRTIQVITSQETFTAKAIDISDTGALIVETQAGKQMTLWAADVSIR